MRTVAGEGGAEHSRRSGAHAWTAGRQVTMLAFVDLEKRVPADHPKGEPQLSHCAIPRYALLSPLTIDGGSVCPI